MLPPQLRSGLQAPRARSLSMSSIPTTVLSKTSARSFWFCRRTRPADYVSQADPAYMRINRYRTLKTRAKLMKSLQRRCSKWEWDVSQRPVFNAKHVRLASHWYGGPRANGWQNIDEAKPEKDREPEDDTDGHDLSQREKEWKEQMEAMRKRISADPYEAVFGKRFEPFWNPLLSKWLNEEKASSQEKPKLGKEEVSTKPISSDRPVPPEPSRAEESTPKAQPLSTNPHESFAYKSSTSWNSWTNKTKRTEWDSRTGQVKRWEYDPVSNRMVQIEVIKAPSKESTKRKLSDKFEVVKASGRDVVKAVSDTTAKSVEKLDNVSPIPHTGKPAAEASTINQKPAVAPSASPKLSAVAKTEPEKGLESLTADGIRASVGKNNRAVNEADDRISSKPVMSLQTSLDRRSHQASEPVGAVLQPSVQRMHSRRGPKLVDLDDAAAHESTEPLGHPANIPKAWNEQTDLLQADRVKRSAGKRPFPMLPRWIDDMQSRKAAYEASQAAQAKEADPAEMARNAKLAQTKQLLEEEVSQQKLAMRSHEERYVDKTRSLRTELDTAYKQSSLNADEYRDRIRKLESRITADEAKLRDMEARYKDKINFFRKELDTAYKRSSFHADDFTQTIRKLEKELQNAKAANGSGNAGSSSEGAPLSKKAKLLQAEGDMCPNVGQFANNGRWYKQSADFEKEIEAQAGKTHQRLRDSELVRQIRAIYEQRYGMIGTEGQQKPAATVEALDSELDHALKKSEKAGVYEFKDDGLEEEIKNQGTPVEESIFQTPTPRQSSPVKITKPVVAFEHLKEDIMPELKECEKQKAYVFRDEEPEKLASSADDHESELTHWKRWEKKDAYTFHEDSPVVESQTELASSTSENEKKNAYAFRDDGLEARIQAEEREVVEARGLMEFEEHSKSRRVAAGNFLEAEQHASTTVAPSTAVAEIKETKPTQLPTAVSTSFKPTPSVQWHQPPLYKILAYDSGNDLFSTATTTSSIVAEEAERPISIPEVLNQLSQPAKFVPHFAPLQQDGFQVVHVNREVLVFRKVAELDTATKAEEEVVQEEAAQETSSSLGARLPSLDEVQLGAAVWVQLKNGSKTAGYVEQIRHASPSGVKVVLEGPGGTGRRSGRVLALLDEEFKEFASSWEGAHLHGYNLGQAFIDTQMAEKAPLTVNPVDKTGSQNFSVSTGNFASPTGFVNHDPVVEAPKKAVAAAKQELKDAEQELKDLEQRLKDTEQGLQDKVRVKRQEPVFTGTQRVSPSEILSRRQQKRERQRQLEQELEQSNETLSSDRGVNTVIAIGLLGLVAYLVGKAADAGKKKVDKEQQLFQGMSEAEKKKFKAALERMGKNES